MIEREAWGAAPPVLAMRPHRPSRITIHHTGTPQRPDLTTAQKIKNLQLFSQREDKLADGRTKPAWGDVPYHYYIGVDGQIAVGRDDRFAGDTNTEYDPAGHVLVVVEGNFENETVNEAQMRSLWNVVWWLAQRDHIPSAEIQSHKDFAQTDCPGADLYARLDALRWNVLLARYGLRSGRSSADPAMAQGPRERGRR
ncbi:MAG: N-acetylmuramoyl-L-alanine amidase [Chthonomonadaceae bacterium]|nr:N-acetylmuramoyl-L-alanine amidase [Chthonomonadaceae bacterium]